MELKIPEYAVDSIEMLSKKIGIEPDFYPKLLKEDDWSFIIKLHALLECSISHILWIALDKKPLQNVLARLELSNHSVGKLAILKDLNILSKEDRRIISELSEMRNQIVHRIENVNFRFTEYLNTISKDKKNSLSDIFASFLPSDQRIETFLNAPRLCIWLSILIMMVELSTIDESREIQEQLDELKNKQHQINFELAQAGKELISILGYDK